jgi:hypothetical protein
VGTYGHPMFVCGNRVPKEMKEARILRLDLLELTLPIGRLLKDDRRHEQREGAPFQPV